MITAVLSSSETSAVYTMVCKGQGHPLSPRDPAVTRWKTVVPAVGRNDLLITVLHLE